MPRTDCASSEARVFTESASSAGRVASSAYASSRSFGLISWGDSTIGIGGTSLFAAGTKGISLSVGSGGTGGRAGDGPRDRLETLGGRVDDVESREVRCEKKELIPTLHELVACFGGSGGERDWAPTMLKGRRPRVVVGVAGASWIVLMRECSPEFLREGVPSLEREFTFVISEALSLPMLDDELGLRCIHRSRTPATALKKFVDPALMVRDIASRVGASCCSSFSSWIPSESRSPMSATTDGFSLQGCLL